MSKIMILGASILQAPAIERAIQMGHTVIAVDMNPNAVGFSIEGVIKEVISTIDTDGVLAAAKRHQIDGIMTLATDMPMQTVAAVCRELKLPGVSPETALKATNKAFMRDALKEYGVPIPMYFRVKEKREFLDAIKTVRDAGFQCIVKPADNSGSRGVDLIEDGSDIEKVYDYSKQYSRGGELVVEEYMRGPEVSVESIATDGQVKVIQITDKLTTGAPFFVEMGHNQPSRLGPELQEQIKEVATKATQAIGIANGTSHTEVIVTPSGPKIVELGARLGGDCIATHLVPLSTGVRMVDCCINLALGIPPETEAKWNKGAAIRYLKTGKGRIKEILGVDEAEAVPGVVQVCVVHGVGETATEIRSSGDRIGYVIAEADNPEAAIEIAEEAARKITVITE